MPIFKRVILDKRRFSRLSALLDCEFTFDAVTRQAVIVDISLNSVLLSSKFLPPNESIVTVLLRSLELKKPLALEGTVVRSIRGISENEEPITFAVQFNRVPPELIKVLNALISKQEATESLVH